MSRKHGRATIPFGQYKGVRIRLLPDDYLSWLTTFLVDPNWHWLRESVLAELRFRGFVTEMASVPDDIAGVTECDCTPGYSKLCMKCHGRGWHWLKAEAEALPEQPDRQMKLRVPEPPKRRIQLEDP